VVIRSVWQYKKERTAVKSRVEIRDTSLPGSELGSRGIELNLQNWQFQNNGKKGFRL
jgi:hypothetical protein